MAQANILLVGVSGARFEDCTFTRLGACAVSLEGGAQNNTISHCAFSDISASAISIGRTNSYNISDPAWGPWTHEEERGRLV